MSLPSVFCANLRAMVKADPRPMKVIAWRAGYNEKYIRRLMYGIQRNPTLLFVESMAEALGVCPLEMMKEKS